MLTDFMQRRKLTLKLSRHEVVLLYRSLSIKILSPGEVYLVFICALFKGFADKSFVVSVCVCVERHTKTISVIR